MYTWDAKFILNVTDFINMCSTVEESQRGGGSYRLSHCGQLAILQAIPILRTCGWQRATCRSSWRLCLIGKFVACFGYRHTTCWRGVGTQALWDWHVTVSRTKTWSVVVRLFPRSVITLIKLYFLIPPVLSLTHYFISLFLYVHLLTSPFPPSALSPSTCSAFSVTHVISSVLPIS